MYVSSKLDFNSYSESDPSDRYDTNNLSKHHNLDDVMESFDKTTVQFLQKLHFHRNVLMFVLGFTTSFGTVIEGA